MKIKELNQATKHITRASKSTDPQKVELDMRKHILDTLNKYEDGPDIPSDTEPTRAERIASDKYLREQAVLPDSRGAFQREVKKVEKETQYPTQATPEQVARLAYNMEKSRQMTGGDGRYDKPRAIIKKKKIIFSNAKVSPLQLSFDYNPKQTFVAPKDTRTILEIVRDGADQRLRQEQENYDKQFGTSGIAMLKRPK